jgi:hypothetical protein
MGGHPSGRPLIGTTSSFIKAGIGRNKIKIGSAEKEEFIVS